MKKPRTRRPANTAEKPAKINRRSFVELLPAAGITGAAMTHLDATPGAATANAQQAQSQTAQKVTKETLHAAEQLIGVELTDAQEAMALSVTSKQNSSQAPAKAAIRAPVTSAGRCTRKFSTRCDKSARNSTRWSFRSFQPRAYGSF